MSYPGFDLIKEVAKELDRLGECDPTLHSFPAIAGAVWLQAIAGFKKKIGSAAQLWSYQEFLLQNRYDEDFGNMLAGSDASREELCIQFFEGFIPDYDKEELYIELKRINDSHDVDERDEDYDKIRKDNLED